MAQPGSAPAQKQDCSSHPSPPQHAGQAWLRPLCRAGPSAHCQESEPGRQTVLTLIGTPRPTHSPESTFQARPALCAGAVPYWRRNAKVSRAGSYRPRRPASALSLPQSKPRPWPRLGAPGWAAQGSLSGSGAAKDTGHHLAHLPFQGSAPSELLGSGNLGWSRPGSLAGVTPAATTARDWGGAWDYRPGPVPDSGPSPQGPVHTTAAPTLSLGQRAMAQLPRLPLWMQKVS